MNTQMEATKELQSCNPQPSVQVVDGMLKRYNSEAVDHGQPNRTLATDPACHIPEFKHYKPKNGHSKWGETISEARTLADELRSTLVKPRSLFKDLKRRIASYTTLGRNYIDNRRLIKQGREDLRPLYFIWTTLRTCNFACTYCDDHMGNKYPDLPNDGVLDTQGGKDLLRIMRTRTSSVYFAGGEPTVRKDLPEMTRTARDLNYYPIIINTNGSLLHRNLKKEEWRDWLANMDIIIVSLDGLDLKMMEKMWIYNRPNDVMRNLLLLRELSKEMNFKLMVNTVIQPDSVEEASDVLDLVNDLDIWFCPVPMNTGPVINPDLSGSNAYLELAAKILARKKQGFKITGSSRMLKRLLYSEPLNCRNTVKPHIDFNGDLVWPCKASVNVPPVKINVLDYPDVDHLYDAASSLVDPTRFHGPASNQCGANCNWAQNYTTDTYVHGLKHPSSLLGEVLAFLKS